MRLISGTTGGATGAGAVTGTSTPNGRAGRRSHGKCSPSTTTPPEDAEPVTDEFEPETITIFTHPRLLVEGDDYGVQLRSTAGGATVRLSPYEAAKLTRALDRHLGSRDSSA